MNLNKLIYKTAFQMFFVVFFIFYLCFAFGYWDTNPMNWTTNGRLIFAILTMIWGGVTWLLVAQVKKDMRAKYGDERKKKKTWKERLEELQAAQDKARGL